MELLWFALAGICIALFAAEVADIGFLRITRSKRQESKLRYKRDMEEARFWGGK